jgi:hypothetical protein
MIRQAIAAPMLSIPCHREHALHADARSGLAFQLIPLNPSFVSLMEFGNPPGTYEDLYLTEQPYGLVCGVETDLPAND